METEISKEHIKRKQLSYSPELKLALIDEYKNVAHNISASRFAKEHDICVTTFFDWLNKVGMRVPHKSNAIDVRSMIPTTPCNTENPIPSEDNLISMMINGNEIKTTKEGIGIIVETLIRCSH